MKQISVAFNEFPEVDVNVMAESATEVLKLSFAQPTAQVEVPMDVVLEAQLEQSL